MGFCIALLTMGAPKTLLNTLHSWRDNLLLAAADQRVAFIQSATHEQVVLLESFGFSCIASEQNVHIGPAYSALAEVCEQESFLFLEDDWVLVEDSMTTLCRLSAAERILCENPSSVVRLRHRERHGDPLYTLCLRGHEMDQPSHLLDTLHWEANPDQVYAGMIGKRAVLTENFYSTTSRYANWTNNPTLIRTEFARSIVAPRAGRGDLEKEFQPWWESQEFPVCQGEGLFEHIRLDR